MKSINKPTNMFLKLKTTSHDDLMVQLEIQGYAK